MTKPTPTPWRTMTMYWPKGYTTRDILGPGDPATVVAQHAQEKNAAHIVHCVNTHDTRERILRHMAVVEGDERNTKKELLQLLEWVRGEARAALAKTKEMR